MHVTQTFAKFLLMATMAAGLPQPIANEPEAHDIEKRIEPSPGGYVGHDTHFNGQKIGSHDSKGWAYLLDQSCSRFVHAAPYEAIGTHRGHKAINIEAIAAYLGPDKGAANGVVSINGEKKPRVCTRPKSERNGQNVNNYSICNFKPGFVWPKPWWPYGNGYN